MLLTHQNFPPSKWWRREIRISFPLWPKWIAQWLCKHKGATPIGGTETHILALCQDCYKSVLTPNTCKHPMESWVVASTTPEPTATGGGVQDIPLTWHCNDCGHVFTREEWCPECGMQMEISAYAGMFSARFRCPTCNEYYFREDLI